MQVLDLSRFPVPVHGLYRVESPEEKANMHRRKHLALGTVALLALVTVAVAYVRHQRIPGFILSSISRDKAVYAEGVG